MSMTPSSTMNTRETAVSLAFLTFLWNIDSGSRTSIRRNARNSITRSPRHIWAIGSAMLQSRYIFWRKNTNRPAHTVMMIAASGLTFRVLFLPLERISRDGYITSAWRIANIQNATGQSMTPITALPANIPVSIPPPNPSDIIPLAM